MMLPLLLVLLSQSTEPSSTEKVAGYLNGLAKPDGGFGWEDQPDGHLTATWAAVGSYRLLGRDVPGDKAAIAAFVRTHHPYRREGSEKNKHATELKTFVLQQIQSLKWLGADPSGYADEVRKWKQPAAYLKQYEKQGFPVLEQETMAFVCRAELGLTTDDLAPAFPEYLRSRRRADGSTNNTPASDGSGGNVFNTAWSVAALKPEGVDAEKTAAWLKSCQAPEGGFFAQPGIPQGRKVDVVSSWAAVRTLKTLGQTPAETQACAAYLRSLWNADGGFGFRPGLPSDPLATYYALDALAALDAIASLTKARARPESKPLPEGLKAFSIQIEAPGHGSPTEAVELARALRISLWGAKNSTPEWIREAQSVATKRGVSVGFFVADEEYGTYIDVPGLGSYSHLVDLAAPANVDFGKSMGGKDPGWELFERERIGALKKAGGMMIWQICDSREICNLLLDTGAYAAVSTFHMRQNFFEFLPFLARYRHDLPFVSLQDAHGEEAWHWVDDLVAHRTVFLAKEPTWEGWQEALKNNWVVSIRHDDFTRGQTRMLGGAPGVQDFVRKTDFYGSDEARRPWASIVVLGSESTFELGRPERGAAIRVRLAGRNTPQAVLTKPLVELLGLHLDGKPLEALRVERKNDKGLFTEIHYRASLPELSSGTYRVSAWLRRLDSGEERTIQEEIRIP